MTRLRNASALPGILPPSLLPPLGSWRRPSGPREPVWREGETIVFLANLGSFRAPSVKRVDLAGGTMLSRPTQNDERRIARLRERALFGLAAWPTPRLEAYVAKTSLVCEDYETAEEQARHRFQRVSLALRLMKPGPVTLSGEMAYQPGVRFSERRFSSWFPGGPLFAVARGDYEFDSSDRSLFRQLYDGLASSVEGAAIAFRRFALANEREAVQDRLVDHWVALESLFSKGGESELRYKFAMRISYFLEREPEPRLELFKRLYDAYQVRSDIVHGGVSKKNMREAEEASATSLRRSLLCVVMEGKPPNPGDLDELAAQGIPRRSNT